MPKSSGIGIDTLMLIRGWRPKAVVLWLSLLLLGCAKPPSIKLYVLNCGSIFLPEAGKLSPIYEAGESLTLPVFCYLVIHPEGILLWDTGISESFVTDRRLENSIAGPSLEQQLGEIDLATADIDFLAFSHLHYDHAGNADLFPDATWILQESEFAAAISDRPQRFSFYPELFTSIYDSEVMLLNGDHDLFGDGTVTFLAAYGHTPGHQLLQLRLENFGPLILSGDLYHTERMREAGVTGFASDRDHVQETIITIEQLLQQSGATLWLGHESLQIDFYPQFPEFID